MLQPPTHTYHRTMATHSHYTALAAAANLQTFPGLLPRYHVQNDITAIIAATAQTAHGPTHIQVCIKTHDSYKTGPM